MHWYQLSVTRICKGTIDSAHKSPWIPRQCGNHWLEGEGWDSQKPQKWGFVWEQNAGEVKQTRKSSVSRICRREIRTHFASKCALKAITVLITRYITMEKHPSYHWSCERISSFKQQCNLTHHNRAECWQGLEAKFKTVIGGDRGGLELLDQGISRRCELN